MLVRQYFYDGWYPSGRRRDADGFEASAALVKAMIIHSANPMHGRGHGEQLTDNVPDKIQGFGLMQVLFCVPKPVMLLWGLKLEECPAACLQQLSVKAVRKSCPCCPQDSK